MIADYLYLLYHFETKKICYEYYIDLHFLKCSNIKWEYPIFICSNIHIITLQIYKIFIKAVAAKRIENLLNPTKAKSSE
jgi:cell division protein FtsW (lipid II flippase)